MANYTPEEFAILKMTLDGKVHYRVFGVWRGGYTTGDSWRLNSGIDWVEAKGPLLLFHGSSGSIYEVHKDMYGTGSMWASSIITGWQKDTAEGKSNVQVEVLDNQDWTQFNFNGGDKDGQ